MEPYYKVLPLFSYGSTSSREHTDLAIQLQNVPDMSACTLVEDVSAGLVCFA